MNIITNKFGSSEIYDIDDLETPIYIECTACMSIWSEALSWANANPQKITTNYQNAQSIVVLGCQVTDLAIYNDIKSLHNLMFTYGYAKAYIGGCLAYRFDIQIEDHIKQYSNNIIRNYQPEIRRLSRFVQDYQYIINKELVRWAEPFWKTSQDSASLFRNSYPLRIGVGCNKKCKYCTINTTRPCCYSLKTEELIDEFLLFPDVVLIADSPTKDQILEWVSISKKYNKPISIRNIEPQVVMSIWNELCDLSHRNLLPYLHCPIQSTDSCILQKMGRDSKSTTDFIIEVRKFPKNSLPNTICATNIIIDYDGEGTTTSIDIPRGFSIVNWNPYWNGQWDYEQAKRRWKYYIH